MGWPPDFARDIDGRTLILGLFKYLLGALADGLKVKIDLDLAVQQFIEEHRSILEAAAKLNLVFSEYQSRINALQPFREYFIKNSQFLLSWSNVSKVLYGVAKIQVEQIIYSLWTDLITIETGVIRLNPEEPDGSAN